MGEWTPQSVSVPRPPRCTPQFPPAVFMCVVCLAPVSVWVCRLIHLKKVQEGIDSWIRSEEPCTPALTSVAGVGPLAKLLRSLCLSILICQVGESHPGHTYFRKLW